MYKHFLFGEFRQTEDLITLTEVKNLLNKAEKIRDNMPPVGIDEIIEVLHKVGLKWRDKNYHLRKYALSVMPDIVGFSYSMTEEAINQLALSLHEDNLRRKVRVQLRDRYLLDKFVFQPKTQNYLKLQSLGIILHVSAGNVFVGPVDSLIQGILTKNFNILKLSSRDPIFPLLFLEALKEADIKGKITQTIAAIAFQGGSEDIEEELKKRCDAILVWGGEEAVANYRKNLPLKTKLIEYGPKVSFIVLTFSGLKNAGCSNIAKLAAKDIVMWEQRACSSAQAIYIEEGDEKLTGNFLKKLSTELEKIKKVYPQEHLSTDEKVELTKMRLLSKMDEAFSEAKVLDSGKNLSWTVVYENKEPRFERHSPLNRFIYVKPYKNLDELAGRIGNFKYYLQTCAIAADIKDFRCLAARLTSCGVNRITEVGRMSEGKPASPHDGKFELAELVKWVNIESSSVRFDLVTNIAGEEIKKPALFNAIHEIFDFSKKFSPFYRLFYKNKQLKNWNDFYALPLIDKNHLYKNTPPRKNRLLTGPLSENYIFSSGGTTGDPKYGFYRYEEFEKVADILTYTYLTAGIRCTDVVANLFVAGNLWASFMAVNAALEKIGCVTMPVSGNSDMGLIANFLSSFKANAILGLPSIVLNLANYVEVNKIKNIKIEKILYGGEHFTVEAKKYLKKILGAKTIRSAGYASVDAGPIGFQCECAKDTIHHVFSEYVYLQIVDPKSSKPLPAGQIGEIVVTLLKRKLMPLIKYRTGDLGRIVSGVCACAREDTQFELLGRCDDIIRVGTVSVYPAEFEENFSAFPELSHIYQIVAQTKDGKDALILRIESKSVGANGVRPLKNNLSLQHKIKRAILKADPELAEAVREKWLGDFAVEVLPPNAIPRTGAGGRGKVRRVVDKRKIG